MSIHARPLWLLAFTLTLIGTTTASLSADSPPPLPVDPAAKEIRDKMVAGYTAAETYRSTVAFTMHMTDGGWTTTRSADLDVAFDRSTSRLALETPDLRVVGDGTHLLMRAVRRPDLHLKLAQPPSLDYTSLLEAIPFVDGQVPPDLTLLLRGDWDGALQSNSVQSVAPGDADAGKEALRFQAGMGAMTLTLAPESSLATHAQLEVDTPARGQARDAVFTLRYNIDVTEA